MPTTFTELSKAIDEVDEECVKYLTTVAPETRASDAEGAIGAVVSKLMKLWNTWLAQCGHAGQPFQLLEQDTNRPPVWIDPTTGSWVVMTFQPGHGPRPTVLTLEQLNEANINHVDLVKGIRRRLHFMTIQAAGTQPTAKA